MQTISGVTNRGTGENTDRGGSTEDDPDLFCVQPLFPQQSWQEGRLHAKCRIEQTVNDHESRQCGRHAAHEAQATMMAGTNEMRSWSCGYLGAQYGLNPMTFPGGS
jgi:hypothetical protein